MNYGPENSRLYAWGLGLKYNIMELGLGLWIVLRSIDVKAKVKLGKPVMAQSEKTCWSARR